MGNDMFDCLSVSAIDNRKSGLGHALDTEFEETPSFAVGTWTARELRLC